MLRTESYRKGIVISTGMNIIAKGIGFVNTLLIAYYFGSNASTDIYFYVLAVVLLISSTVNAIDYLVLIPEAMKLQEQSGTKSAHRFLNFFIYTYGIIGGLLAVLCVISPVIFYTVFSKFDSSLLRENSRLLYSGSAIIFFHLLNSLLTAILVSYKYFTVAIFASLINSVFAIVFTLLFKDKLGIAGTILGIALGYFINFIMLVLMMKRYQHWDFTNVAWVKSKKIWNTITLMQINILPIWVRNSVTLYLLSGLEHGIITAVNLTQQITVIIDVLLISQVLSVVGIKLNECNSRNDQTGANTVFVATANTLMIFVLPIITVGIFYSTEILNLLFKNSVDKATFGNMDIALKYLLLLVPYAVFNSLTTRLFAAFQLINKTVWYSFVTHIIFLILAYWFITTMGYEGYFYSQLAGYSLLILLFYLLMKREVPFIKFNRTLVFAGSQLLVNGIVGFAIWELNRRYFLINGLPLLMFAFFIQACVILLVNYKNPLITNITQRIYVYWNKKSA